MSISVNRATIVGRLGADPEARGQQQSVVVFRVATSESWRDKNSGERQERTQWHSVVVFAEQAGKFVMQYAKKGDLVFVEGTIETRKYEKDGRDVYTTEIVVRPFGGSVQLQPKGDKTKADDSDEDRDDRGGSPRTAEAQQKGRGSSGRSRDLDDEIPFAPEWR